MHTHRVRIGEEEEEGRERKTERRQLDFRNGRMDDSI